MIKRKVVITGDDSSTVYVESIGQHFHSHFGAVQESKHIFIDAGFCAVKTQNMNEISILEIGMGTGLNILLTYLESVKKENSVFYETVEKYPLTHTEVKQLNYIPFLKATNEAIFFSKIHTCEWGVVQKLATSFTLLKHHCSILKMVYPINSFHLVYFDAFSPEVQPELWTYELFSSIYQSLKPQGILVTYCTKGEVKRILKSIGFQIEKLPGPPGKKEFLRARKNFFD